MSAGHAAAGAVPSDLSTEQFKGVAGARQIGPEFPTFDRRTPTGAQAIYLVETDALTAMNAFVERARQLGFLQLQYMSPGYCVSTPYGPNNRVAAPGEARVRCEAQYGRADGTGLTIQIWVCESCPDPDSTASVAIAKAGGKGVGPIPGLEPISTTLGLPADSLRSVLTPTDASLAQAGFPVVKGTQLAAPVFAESTLCALTWVAPLRIVRDPAHAFDVYTKHMFGSRNTAQSVKTSGGRQVTYHFDARTQRRLTLVRGGTLRQPWMLASECERTLD
jgi:hypothetical protein